MKLKKYFVTLVVCLTLLAAAAGVSVNVANSLASAFATDGQAIACGGQSGGGC